MGATGTSPRIVGMAVCIMLLIATIMVGEGRAQSAPDYAALLAAPDRSDADREADTRRDPKPFLEFAVPSSRHESARYGRRRGYSSELIARAVAPGGTVYAQNPSDLPDNLKLDLKPDEGSSDARRRG